MNQILCIWIVGLSVGLWLPAMSVSAESKSPAPLPVEQMRAAAYTREFAKRFNLPEPAADMIPTGGLQAVEFRVELSDRVHAYFCRWYVYLDDSIPIAYPRGDAAGRIRLFNGHFFDRTRPSWPSREDSYAYSDNSSSYYRMVQFATADYDPRLQRGARESTSLFEFARNIVTGVSYLNVDSCMFGHWLKNRSSDISLWLKKADRPDYRTKLGPSEDFHQLVLPSGLISRAAPWASQVIDYNRAILDAADPVRRQRMQPQVN